MCSLITIIWNLFETWRYRREVTVVTLEGVEVIEKGQMIFWWWAHGLILLSEFTELYSTVNLSTCKLREKSFRMLVESQGECKLWQQDLRLYHNCVSFHFFMISFEICSHISQTDFKEVMKLKVILNFWFKTLQFFKKQLLVSYYTFISLLAESI